MQLCMASKSKFFAINLHTALDIQDHVIKNTPDSMILKFKISAKILKS